MQIKEPGCGVVYQLTFAKLIAWYERGKQKLGWITTVKDFQKIFQGGNSTFINSFDKTQFLFHSPTDAAPQLL